MWLVEINKPLWPGISNRQLKCRRFFHGIIRVTNQVQSMKKSVTNIVATPGLQPRGGFIDPHDMEAKQMSEYPEGGIKAMLDVTTSEGNFSSQSLGLVFDYLLRTEIAIMSGEKISKAVVEAFEVSCRGAIMINKWDKAQKLVRNIALLYAKSDDREENLLEIAQNALELVMYDAVFRAGYYNPKYKPAKLNKRDFETLSIMLGSVEDYLAREKERIISLGFGFTAKGAKNVAPSDGDLLTEYSLINIKCSIKEPTSKHTLQLLMYYILGMHEYPTVFGKLKYLKILNPRLDKIYSYEIAKIDKDTLRHVEKEIIGYRKSAF